MVSLKRYDTASAALNNTMKFSFLCISLQIKSFQYLTHDYFLKFTELALLFLLLYNPKWKKWLTNSEKREVLKELEEIAFFNFFLKFYFQSLKTCKGEIFLSKSENEFKRGDGCRQPTLHSNMKYREFQLVLLYNRKLNVIFLIVQLFAMLSPLFVAQVFFQEKKSKTVVCSFF